MANIKAISGFDHRFIATYHPRANSAAEVHVKLAKSALMKLVSSDWSHWSTFLLAAQFVINQRLTSRHKLTPFELFLGRPVNLPSDYSNVESDPIPEADCLAQIAKLHSIIMSIAHDSSVSLVEFKPSDTVMLHHSATTSKMDLKYLNPFSIKHRTKSGAYILVDVTGNELEDRIPPSLLKLVSSLPSGSLIPLSSIPVLPDKTDMESQANPDGSDDVNFESDDDDDNSSKSYKVSKVLDHHGPTNHQEYKVRWKGYFPKYDLWIPVKNFDDL